MEEIVGAIFFSIIGYLYLWIRYRNGEKVAKIKEENYEGKYAVAGAQFLFSIVGVLLFILLLGLLIAVIYSAINNPEAAAVR